MLYSLGAFSQYKTYPLVDTVVIEGYYLIQFDKNDIKYIYINEKKKKANNSYKIPIDTEFYPYYFTVKLNNNNVLDKGQIASFVSLQPNFKNTEIYKFRPAKNNSLVDSIFSLYKISYDVNKTYEIPINKTYFQLSSKADHLFSIYAVKGKAVRFPVNMDWNVVLANKWEIIPTHINKQIPAFYIYYLYDFELSPITENSQIAGFSLWHND